MYAHRAPRTLPTHLRRPNRAEPITVPTLLAGLFVFLVLTFACMVSAPDLFHSSSSLSKYVPTHPLSISGLDSPGKAAEQDPDKKPAKGKNQKPAVGDKVATDSDQDKVGRKGEKFEKIDWYTPDLTHEDFFGPPLVKTFPPKLGAEYGNPVGKKNKQKPGEASNAADNMGAVLVQGKENESDGKESEEQDDKKKGKEDEGGMNAREKEEDEEQVWRARQSEVKRAFQHAWTGYSKFAWGHDEVRPQTNETNDSWGGYAVTMIDGLDTAMVMGFEEEVNKAKDFIQNMNFNRKKNEPAWDANFFEANIRYVGGLLGAHGLSGDKLYLSQAKKLAELLAPSFDVQESGMPVSVVNLRTGEGRNHVWNQQASVLAEVGSCQLEYAYLGKVNNAAVPLWRKARKVFSRLHEMDKRIPGLYPVYIKDLPNGELKFSSERLAVGSLADSFYEYLLKVYIMSKGQDQQALAMYVEAIEAIRQHLIRVVVNQGEEYAFVGELAGDTFLNKQEHLSCFLGGTLALGASVFPADADVETMSEGEKSLFAKAKEHLVLAEQLANGCWLSYQSTTTGLGPEVFSFHPPRNTQDSKVVKIEGSKYLLRPELIETFFVLYRVTGKTVYRERGYAIFQGSFNSAEHRVMTPGIAALFEGNMATGEDVA
eukprot:g4032.t1